MCSFFPFLFIRKALSPPRTPVSHSSASSPLTTVGRVDGGALMPKHGQFMLRAPHPSQASELYYQEHHPAYDTAHYQATCESDFLQLFVLLKWKGACCFLIIFSFFLLSPPACSFYPSTLHTSHKPCMAHFLRSSNLPETSLQPSIGPTASSYPSDPQNPHPPSTSSSRYPPHPPRDQLGPTFHSHPGQPQYGPLPPAHGVYTPLYDSRRVWRPQVSSLITILWSNSIIRTHYWWWWCLPLQLYHREDARSNSLPPEVLHSSVYQPPLRERFNSLDSNYCSGAEHRPGLHRVGGGTFNIVKENTNTSDRVESFIHRYHNTSDCADTNRL